jgi:flagellar biosynthetic protein FliR
LVFSRVGAVAFLLPGVGERYIPARYKLAIALILSGSVFTARIDISTLPSGSEVQYWIFMLQEASIGIVLGLTIRSAIFSLQICGSVIAQSSSIAQIFGGSVSNDAQSTISNILTISGITLLMSSGFLETVLEFIIFSYSLGGLQINGGREGILSFVLKLMSNAFNLAFQLSLPFLALSLLYNITLGAINRAMPQLLVSFVGAPAIIAASISLFVVSIQPLLGEWREITFDITISLD